MKKAVPYLTFAGNCREALNFYKQCLGGELTIQTIADSPMAEQMPEKMASCILHAELVSDGIVLMGSDMTPETGVRKGNALSIMLDCSSEQELRAVFKALSSGGSVKHDLETTFWGALFGDLTDKYGNNWLLNFQQKETTNNEYNEKR
jgi:PhnB protein